MLNRTKLLIFGGAIYVLSYAIYFMLAVLFSETFIEAFIYWLADYITPLAFLFYCFYVLFSKFGMDTKLKNAKVFMAFGWIAFALYFFNLFYLTVTKSPFDIFVLTLFMAFVVAYIIRLNLKTLYTISYIAVLLAFVLSGFLFVDKVSYFQNQALNICNDIGVCAEGLVLKDEMSADWVLNEVNCQKAGRWDAQQKSCILHWSSLY